MSYRYACNVHDLRAIARRRLPRVVFEILDRTTEDDVTLHVNREAFERNCLPPRNLVGVSNRSQKMKVPGKEFTFHVKSHLPVRPVFIASKPIPLLRALPPTRGCRSCCPRRHSSLWNAWRHRRRRSSHQACS